MKTINKKLINKIKKELLEEEIPCYVYDLNEIKNRIDNVTENMPNNFRLYYAIKANPNKLVLDYIKTHQKVAGFEIASSGELDKALEHCCSNEILYTGPAKTNNELIYAITNNIRLINVESVVEAIRINNIASKLNKKVDILIRINMNYKIEDAAENMGGLSTKMGIDEDKYLEEYKTISSLTNLNIKGIHVFSASGILNYEAGIEYAKYVLNMVKFYEEQGQKIEIIDLGGGFGIDYTDENKEFDCPKYFKPNFFVMTESISNTTFCQSLFHQKGQIKNIILKYTNFKPKCHSVSEIKNFINKFLKCVVSLSRHLKLNKFKI